MLGLGGQRDPPPTTEGVIAALFRLLDPAGLGVVPLGTLLHALAGVDTPTRLALPEVRASAGLG
jgi:hypothetical protein